MDHDHCKVLVCPVANYRQVFVPEKKWGPMSHLPLAQDAQRWMLASVQQTLEALKAAPENARLVAKLRDVWRTFATVNAAYIDMKVCRWGTFMHGAHHGISSRGWGQTRSVAAPIETVFRALEAPMQPKNRIRAQHLRCPHKRRTAKNRTAGCQRSLCRRCCCCLPNRPEQKAVKTAATLGC
jgi:hypothetical protein